MRRAGANGSVTSLALGFAVGLAFCALCPSLAFAQTASQITPPSFAPPLERQGGFVVPSAAGLDAPAGAEKLFVTLSGISIVGGLPELKDATSALETKLMGRAVSGAEVFAAARDLEAAYATAGYVLVRVVLPPQKLVNGARLKLVVIDGFIERVETGALPERVRNRITRLVSPLTGRRGLKLVEIERRVLLAGDTPGVVLRSTLAPGTEQGATVLVIEASYQAVSETLTYDNTLARALGHDVLGVGVDFNSVAGLGELSYFRASGSAETNGSNGFFERYPRNRALAAGVIVPLWIDGATFNVEYTDARTTPLATGGFQTTSVFDRMSLRLRYAWIRSRAANFNSEVAFDAQNETQSLFVGGVPIPLSEDRLRIVRYTNDGDVLTSWRATISGRVTGSFGIDGLDARTAAQATPLLPLSRQGADATFQKVDIALAYNQPLAEHLAASVAGRAQYSFNAPLLRSEQIGIANTTGLSAFDSGTIVGDQGYVVRGEVTSPWTLPLQNPSFGPKGPTIGVVVAPYIFGARGEVHLQQPTALEAPFIRATSYGGGVRIGGAAAGTISNGSLTLEYGRAERDGAVASNRYTVVSAFRF